MADVEIIRSLGSNAMASVHLAREPALKRLVAIKALRPELADDPIAVKRFEREAQSAARITHQNVCAIHRVGRTPKGVPFIVMEYVDGRKLDGLLAAEGSLGTERALSLLAQVAAAVAAAHEKGVIHRDLRPANIIVEHQTSRVVLTDFGIAAIHASGTVLVTRLTQQGEILGSPAYASPEQLAGSEATEASDVYSFGLVAADVLNAAAGGTADPDGKRAGLPVPLHEGVPAPLRDLLRRCLAEDPERRPSAARVRDTLAEFVADPKRLTAPRAREADDSLLGVGLSFLAELRRRKVYRIAAGYAAGAIVLIELADVLGPTLRIPQWLFRGLVAVLLGGFPIAVTLAWMFDLTTKGLRRTRDTGATGLRRWLMFVALPLLGLSLSISAAAYLGWWILRD